MTTTSSDHNNYPPVPSEDLISSARGMSIAEVRETFRAAETRVSPSVSETRNRVPSDAEILRRANALRAQIDSWDVKPVAQQGSSIESRIVNTAHRSVVVNSDNQLVPDHAIPTGVPGKMVDESQSRFNLYSDKTCSVRRCKDTVQWQLRSGRLRDPYANEEGFPRGVEALGPAVMDSLQAQIEFAHNSVKNRPLGSIVKDDSEYFCEAHWRERECRLTATAEQAAAEFVRRNAAEKPFLWSLDPTDVRIELKDNGDFLLTFPDGFSMSWEQFRVSELNAWRKNGRKAP